MKAPKKVILETLNQIDNVQAEKVVDFIKSLLESNSTETRSRLFKQKALREIRNALNKEEGLEYNL